MTKSTLLTEAFKFAILTAIFAVAMPGLGFAQSELSDLVAPQSTLARNLGSTTNALAIVAYVMGSFMMVSGALKLKAHAENPSEKLAPGIARVVGGGALIAVPALTRLISGSLFDEQDGAAAFHTFTSTFSQ